MVLDRAFCGEDTLGWREEKVSITMKDAQIVYEVYDAVYNRQNYDYSFLLPRHLLMHCPLPLRFYLSNDEDAIFFCEDGRRSEM